MSRSQKRAGFAELRGSTNKRFTISADAPTNPQNKETWLDQDTNQWYYYNKPTTEWIPIFSSGGGSVTNLTYHNDTNTTAVTTNVEVGTVDITMALDGSIIVTGTFVGTASATTTLTTLIKLDTVTQHTIVDYVSGAVDHTVNFSVVLEGITAGDYTISVDMASSAGTFTLDASEQHLYCLAYYDAVIGGDGGGVVTTAGYIFGGGGSTTYSDTDEYTPDSWTSKTDIPSPARRYLASSAINSKAYIYCGYLSSSVGGQDCDEYIVDSWTNKTDTPTPPRRALGSSTIASSGYIYCGLDRNGSTRYQDTDEYTPDSWTSKTDAPLPAREQLSASTIGSSGYIFSGYTGSALIADTDEYTPDTWTSKTNITTSRRTHTSTTLDSKAYVISGLAASGRTQVTEEYVVDSWASKTNFSATGKTFLSSSFVGGAIYAYCGRDNTTYQQDCDEYIADTWTSKTDAPLPARDGIGASSL